jgi:hypothetical protein
MNDMLPECPFEEGHPKHFEYQMEKGEMCKYYPYTGAYYGLESKRIIKNDGGRKDFDGSALATKRHADRREAIAQGLTEAAIESGLGSTPTDMLAEVVKRQAQQALQETRDGTNAAKFVWGIVGYKDEEEKNTASARVTVELDADSVANILRKLADE